MARVNHKLVKQRLNENRSKITDRQFFSSRILAGHFEDMAAAQTKRYHYNRRVRVNLYWKPKDKSSASTNNQDIRINAGHKIVTKVRGRENRYQVVCGMFSHELGHVLYTDFVTAQTHINALENGRWYPATPDLKSTKDILNEKAIWDYMKAEPENMKLFLQVAHFIFNILEDGYIEHRFLEQFPGTLGYGLETLRNIEYKEVPTVTQLIENEDENSHIFLSITQIMLSYALFGEIKYGDEPLTEERIKTVFNLISEIDQAVMIKSFKNRANIVNLILVRLWDYIEDYLEVQKQYQKDIEAAGGSETTEEIVSTGLHALVGSSPTTGSGGTPISEDAVEVGEIETSGQRAKTHEDAKSGDGEDRSLKEKESVSGAEKPGDKEDKSTSENTKAEVSDSEAGRLPKQRSDSVSDPVGGSMERNEDYKRGCYERAATDIERMLDKMAERAACKQLENERLQELNDVAQNISYGDIHKGVNMVINRIDSVDEELVDQYNMIAEPLVNISRQLQKSLLKQLKESRRGGKQTGLIMGRRLDVHALYRNDGKVFYKNSLPHEIPELVVGLLLDESGSMRSCDRSTYARASAIILYDFCQNLGIPIMVYGHSTGSGARAKTVEMYSYAEFDSIDMDDKYRMMDISARSENRDGAALRYVAEQLSKRPEEVKILILVSDGQPADTGYHGSAAEEDLRGIKQEYQKKGILLISAAIGDDKQNIERIYSDSYMDITDLNQLPIKLTGVVKRHIRI